MPRVTIGILGANARAYMCNRVGIVVGYRKIEPMYYSTGHTYKHKYIGIHVQIVKWMKFM